MSSRTSKQRKGMGAKDDGNSYPSTPNSSPSLLSSQSASSSSFEEVARSKAWCDAMDVEMNALEQNKTWDLVNLPKEKEVIGLKWIYKLKLKPDGSIQKYKVRLVARGYMQVKVLLLKKLSHL
ncbi:UNVERIFIED_CONTAM: Retrovirus-related Pol polyprotein from transposon TNT 1-94 [Sesamum radiatum]|uniref:Retrovirus-related Pol polyprotein from transposon TNT 1-94 n=1 Tax=Sesamum radiatum TaxID=300843 RepID=A0AAW2S2A4_SESRA